MNADSHTHDCTGPDVTCPCGYVFRVPPVSFALTVSDGRITLVDEWFNCESTQPVIAALRRAADRLEAGDYGRVIDVGQP